MENRIYKFREHEILRTCDKSYRDYHNYKSFLKIDFKSKCAYCNLSDNTVTTPFEIDHFVPYKKFKESFPELETDYNNLVYSCKKCNLAKRDKHKGGKDDNLMFYNPVTVDMNKHFCRIKGKIIGLDQKANEQILELKLYRPIHELEWIVEKLHDQIIELDNKIATENNMDEKEIFTIIKNRLLLLHFEYDNILKLCYNYSEKDDIYISLEHLEEKICVMQ